MNLLKFLPATGLLVLSQAVLSAPGSLAPDTLPPDKVLASNQWTSVTYAEFQAEMARIPLDTQYEFLLDRQRLATLVDNILINKTLAKEARDNKLDQLPHVQAEIANQTEKVLARYRGQQVQSEAPKIDYAARAREMYLANPQRYEVAENFHVWHVLVSNAGRTKAEARAKAEQLRTRLLAGEALDAIAKESDDPSSKRNKGDLDQTTLKGFDENFAAAVRALKVGDISAPVETSFGFHIIKLLGHNPVRKIPFETAKIELMKEAEVQYLRTYWDLHVQKIRNDPKIAVDTDALDRIRSKVPTTVEAASTKK